MTASWPAAVFDRLYASSPDPWGFRTSRYEAAKYRATLAALGRRRFRQAFEPGCSIGELTRLLAPRCAHLLATDLASAALAQARLANQRHGHVIFRQAQVPRDWPAGRRFDLIVFSEILYFLSPADLRRTARRAAASLRPDGLILLVNYTGRTNTPLTGQRAARGFAAAASLPAAGARKGRFRIDIVGCRKRHKPAN